MGTKRLACLSVYLDELVPYQTMYCKPSVQIYAEFFRAQVI
jgi:hypothetical protein